jgi:hypothetical protein
MVQAVSGGKRTMWNNIYNNERIGSTLLKDKLITDDQWNEALEAHKEQGGFIGKILVEKEFLMEEELLSYFLEQYGVPYLPPAQYPINPEAKDFLPEETARKYLLLPVDKEGYRLTVICPGPLERASFAEAFEACKGTPATFFLSTISEIETALDALYTGK